MDHDEQLACLGAGPARDELMPLLLLADDSAMLVKSYCQLGDLFVLRGVDGEARGVVLVVRIADATVELKAVAVAPRLQGRGVGQRLIKKVLAELRAGGVRRVLVGAASCGVGELAFYQKVGFRLWRIERDYFTRERGYPDGLTENGIPLRDMVWMDLDVEKLNAKSV
jgi:ribosomal protein S18 acetylase RimI-like enzyme